MNVKGHLAYLWYVLRHKYFVFVECCRLGVPWRGLVHDLSKLSPKAGDLIWVKVPREMTLEATEAFRDTLGGCLPDGVQVVVVGQDFDLALLDDDARQRLHEFIHEFEGSAKERGGREA